MTCFCLFRLLAFALGLTYKQVSKLNKCPTYTSVSYSRMYVCMSFMCVHGVRACVRVREFTNVTIDMHIREYRL